MGRMPPRPGCFRKSGKCRTYGIRNSEECTERIWRMRSAGNTPSPHRFCKELYGKGLGGGGRQKDCGARTYKDEERLRFGTSEGWSVGNTPSLASFWNDMIPKGFEGGCL